MQTIQWFKKVFLKSIHNRLFIVESLLSSLFSKICEYKKSFYFILNSYLNVLNIHLMILLYSPFLWIVHEYLLLDL